MVRFADALARVAGDCELLVAMAAMVAEDAPAVLQELRDSVATKDMENTAVTAHKLKGMLSTFETAGPVLELEELISSARAGKEADVKLQLKVYEPRLTKLLDEISSLATST
jgi:Hpt domain